MNHDIYDSKENIINIGKTTLAWADRKTFKIINLRKTHPEMYDKLEKLM